MYEAGLPPPVPPAQPEALAPAHQVNLQRFDCTTGKPSWHGGHTQVREEEWECSLIHPTNTQTQSLKTFDPPSFDSFGPSSVTLSTLP